MSQADSWGQVFQAEGVVNAAEAGHSRPAASVELKHVAGAGGTSEGGGAEGSEEGWGE